MWEAPWTFQNKRLPSDGIGTLPLNLQNKSFLKDTVTDATFTYVWFHFWFQVPLFCSAESESEENLKALSYLCFIFVRLMYSEHWFFQKAQTCISAGMDWTAHLYGSSFRTNDIVRFLIYLLEPRGEQTAATVNPQLVLILKPSNCSTFYMETLWKEATLVLITGFGFHASFDVKTRYYLCLFWNCNVSSAEVLLLTSLLREQSPSLYRYWSDVTTVVSAAARDSVWSEYLEVVYFLSISDFISESLRPDKY